MGGGALVSNNADFNNKAIFLATQARDEAPHYQHSTIGYNYRMSRILAAIGCRQMELIEERIRARRMNFEFYQRELDFIQEFTFLEEPKGFLSNRWLTTLLTGSFVIREHVRISLEKENIESRPLWKPMHLQPIFKDFPKYTNGVSKELFKKGLCLPSGSNLTAAQKDGIIKTIKSIF